MGMMLDDFGVSYALGHTTVLVDTREHSTEDFWRRVSQFPCTIRRQKLNFGDYSIECELPDGTMFSLADKFSIERKMSLEEISNNFTKGRERFEREFQRCKDSGAKMDILIENGSLDKIFNHFYRTKFKPVPFIASLLTWESRYNAGIHFCSSADASKLIYSILYYQLKEHLKNGQGMD